MRWLGPHIRRFARDERATATLEFVIVFPLIIILFIAVFETGIILSRQVLMERSLDEAVRILRLAQDLTVSAADIEDAICDNTGSIPNCDTVLSVDLHLINQTSYALPPSDVGCHNLTDPDATPANSFTQGSDNTLMLIRVCAAVERILPFSGFGLNLTRDDAGGLYMIASSVFVNEPD